MSEKSEEISHIDDVAFLNTFYCNKDPAFFLAAEMDGKKILKQIQDKGSSIELLLISNHPEWGKLTLSLEKESMPKDVCEFMLSHIYSESEYAKNPTEDPFFKGLHQDIKSRLYNQKTAVRSNGVLNILGQYLYNNDLEHSASKNITDFNFPDLDNLHRGMSQLVGILGELSQGDRLCIKDEEHGVVGVIYCGVYKSKKTNQSSERTYTVKKQENNQ